MNHCKDCKFLGEKKPGWVMRECLLAGRNESLFNAAPHYGLVMVHPDFGCVQFEAKPIG